MKYFEVNYPEYSCFHSLLLLTCDLFPVFVGGDHLREVYKGWLTEGCHRSRSLCNTIYTKVWIIITLTPSQQARQTTDTKY